MIQANICNRTRPHMFQIPLYSEPDQILQSLPSSRQGFSCSCYTVGGKWMKWFMRRCDDLVIESNANPIKSDLCWACHEGIMCFWIAQVLQESWEDMKEKARSVQLKIQSTDANIDFEVLVLRESVLCERAEVWGVKWILYNDSVPRNDA